MRIRKEFHKNQLDPSHKASLSPSDSDSSSSHIPTSGEDPPSLSTDEFFLGDLSIRLLSSLIEENILVTAPSSTNFNQSQLQQPQQSLLNNVGKNGGGGKSSIIFPNQSPITNYDYNTQLTLEERIQLELKSLGIYDDYSINNNVNLTSSSSSISSSNNNHLTGSTSTTATTCKISEKEDDEICAELRLLQQQLREQMIINNQLKSQSLQGCKSVMLFQETIKKRKQNHISAEKNYLKFMKRDRKKKRLKSTTNNSNLNNANET
eukprot:gene12285-15020_t